MLIGLTGRAQSGKDTVYQELSVLYGPVRNVERRAFADRLYESAAQALGVAASDLREWKLDDRVSLEVVDRDPGVSFARVGHLVRLTVREYLQRYGTEAHRDVFGEGFWVDALDLTHGDHDLVVVTDVRFPNEAEAIRAHGGHVVRVVGPPTVDDDHPSEAPIEDHLVDHVLDNTRRDGTPEQGPLRRNVVQMMLDLTSREKWWTR